MWWLWQRACLETVAAWIGDPQPKQEFTTDNAAAKYHVMAENGNQILCLLNRQQGCSYLSTNWQRITGLTPQSSLGWAFFERLALGDASSAQSLAKGAPASISRLQITHADGSSHWYEFSCCSAESVTGCADDSAYLLQNIDSHVRTQDSLQLLHFQLNEALQDRLCFFGKMSHDLRTPLNAIIGFTEMMQAGTYGRVASERYEDYLQHIRASGYELLERIDDLLDNGASQPKPKAEKTRVLDFVSSA